MSPVFPARRRAEQFDALVESTSTDRSNDARFADLLTVVEAVRSVPQVEPRPEFTESLRARLMTEAATALAVAPDAADPALEERLTVAPRRTARERRFAVAIGGVAIVGATTSMALAAQSAMPGDVLYPVKRAMENVQTSLRGDEARGSVLLAHASGRLAEVGALSTSGSADTDEVTATLTTFAEQATEASELLLQDFQSTGDESSVEELRDFTAESLTELTELEPLVPEGARGALLAAAQVLFTIDQAAQQACPSCAGTGITDLPAVLLDPMSATAPTVSVPQRLEQVEPGTTIEKDTAGDGGLVPAPGTRQQPGVGQQPADGGDGGSSGGGGANGDGGSDPLTDLTDGLTDGVPGGGLPGTGQGGSGNGGSGAGVSGPTVPEAIEDAGQAAEDILDDAAGDLLNP